MADEELNTETTEEVQQQQEPTPDEESQSDAETSEEQPAEDTQSDKGEDDGEPDIFAMSDEEYEEYLANIKKNPAKKEYKQEQPKEKEQSVEKPLEKQEEQAEKEFDYKAFYQNLMKPFKANGREVTPKTPDDIVQLMQMGANYTKKMQQLAPVKRVAETLRKANISEQDLNTLIDIHNGNKEAIVSMLKKHKIDPTEIDVDEDVQYTPNNHAASDRDVEFTDTLRDINDSLPKINEILEKNWDNQSKAMLIQNPQLLRKLHQEIQLGRFDKIQAMLESEKALGRYEGVPDIQAYSDIVTKVWYAEQQEAQKAKQQPSKPTTPVDTKEREKKLKAAPNRNTSVPQKQKITTEQMSKMSDEEFSKLF